MTTTARLMLAAGFLLLLTFGLGMAQGTAPVARVTELVRQHRGMHGQMGQMHQRMMGGMMGGRGMMRGR